MATVSVLVSGCQFSTSTDRARRMAPAVSSLKTAFGPDDPAGPLSCDQIAGTRMRCERNAIPVAPMPTNISAQPWGSGALETAKAPRSEKLLV